MQHPYIAETKWEIRGRDENWKRTLVVMTRLTLDPGAENYSEQEEAELLAVVADYWKRRSGIIDAVNIRSVA